jgi:hypothetical protein
LVLPIFEKILFPQKFGLLCFPQDDLATKRGDFSGMNTDGKVQNFLLTAVAKVAA